MNKIDDIRARLEAVTPGEWRAFDHEEAEFYEIAPNERVGAWWLEGPAMVEYGDYSCFARNDAEFIAHAPGDMRLLLARIADLEEALAGLRSVTNMKLLPHARGVWYCPVCRAESKSLTELEQGKGHKDNCEYVEALLVQKGRRE